MSYEADKMDEPEIEEAIALEAELVDARTERDKYAASLFVARAWLQIQANRKGSLLFTYEVRKAAEIALEIIANPELCLKAHDETRDKEKDYQIRQLRNVLAEAARALLKHRRDLSQDFYRQRNDAIGIARFLGYEAAPVRTSFILPEFDHKHLDAFLSSVSVSEPNV